jgi:hypothetical protein
MIKLKNQLMRLISPMRNQKDDVFEVEIIAKDEISVDSQEKIPRNKVNGIIINDTFDTIKDYAVFIDLKLAQNNITLELYDR